MKITFLGSGYATATNCYNTSFLIDNDSQYLLVDAGGGNGILNQAKKINFDWTKLNYAFISHAHIDHLLGIFWVLRSHICRDFLAGKRIDLFHIYCHDEVAEIIRFMVIKTFSRKYSQLLDDKIIIHLVEDRQKATLIGLKFTFIDILATSAKQFGFQVKFGNNKIFTFLGDEPCNPKLHSLIKKSDYLIHEAMCTQSEEDVFHPHQKHHSTVVDACQVANQCEVGCLIITHTEDKDQINRQSKYLAESQQHFKGKSLVPSDLEVIELV